MKGKHNVWISGLSVLLAMALLLSGCGLHRDSSGESTEDISADTVVMMVGDCEVRYREVMAYRYFLKCQYEESFGKTLWQYQVNDGETIGDQAKQEIVNMITQLKVITEVAQEQKISLSADEQDEALRKAEDLVQSAKAADKKQYSLSVQGLSDIYEENLLAEKMFYVATDAADTNVTDAEARQTILAEQTASATGGAVQAAGEEDISISAERLEQEKETIIRERQTQMFVEKYQEWLQDRKVDIDQNFWSSFSL